MMCICMLLNQEMVTVNTYLGIPLLSCSTLGCTVSKRMIKVAKNRGKVICDVYLWKHKGTNSLK